MFGHSLTNLQTKEKPRTIHGEVIKKNIQGVASLIENGVNPNLQDEEGNTPLHIIALDDDDVNIAIAKLLLKKGADPNLEDQKGKVPLHIAAIRKNPQMVDVLLASEKTVVDLQDNRRRTPLFDAVGPDLYFYGKNKEAIEKQEDLYRVETFGDKAEHIVKALLSHGADPNVQDENDNTPLHVVAFANAIDINIAIVKLLLDDNADPNSRNENGNTPLHFLADTCYPEISEMAQLLLENGADPNLKNQEGVALLHTAAFRKDFILVNILLKSEKTDVNLPDEFGWTPLFYAVDYEGEFYQVKDIITALLERGASRNYQDKNGETPLHIAARKGRRNTIDMLIEWGAEVNVQNKAGETPLYIAVVARESELVERLINCGADVNIESHAGYTPFYLAATGWFSYYDRGNEPEYRPLFDMVKIFLDRKEDTIDWKDEGYRKKLLKDIGDERIKELLIPVFQKVAMWDLWIMETEEYESYFQWLPRELVEDIQWSFFSRDHILKRKRIAEEEEHENAKRFCQDLVDFSYRP
jgi:ankyrin repeat protein